MMRKSLPPLAPKRANPPPNSLKWLATSNYVGRSARKPKSMHVSKERLTPRPHVEGVDVFNISPPAY